MKTSLFMCGSGGQGVQVAGMMLLSAMDRLGRHASFFPEYGANKRGGFSQCAVVTSDEPITSFTAARFDVAALLNERAWEKHGDAVKPSGTLILNSCLISNVPQAPDYSVARVPFDEIARNLGNQKVMNTLLFGFLAGYEGLVDRQTALSIVLEATGEKAAFRDMNKAALLAGFAEAEKQKRKNRHHWKG